MANIGKNKTYTVPTTAAGYPDTGELTNGQILLAILTNGWVGFDAGNPAIVIDLGASQLVHLVEVFLLRMTGSSVQLPSNILVEVGDGASSWATLGNVVPSGTDGTVVFARVNNGTGITNRYVRLTFTRVSTLLIGQIGVFNDSAGLHLELYNSREASLSTIALTSLVLAQDIRTNAGALIANLPLLVAGQTNSMHMIAADVIQPVVINTNTGANLVFVSNSIVVEIISQIITYENGFVKIEVTLNKPVGLTAWLEKGGVVISPPRSSLIPATTHTILLPIQQSGNVQAVDVILEVVNV